MQLRGGLVQNIVDGNANNKYDRKILGWCETNFKPAPITGPFFNFSFKASISIIWVSFHGIQMESPKFRVGLFPDL